VVVRRWQILILFDFLLMLAGLAFGSGIANLNGVSMASGALVGFGAVTGLASFFSLLLVLNNTVTYWNETLFEDLPSPVIPPDRPEWSVTYKPRDPEV
jgi:hypothetical protein